MSTPKLTNFRNGKSVDDFLWNLRMTGQLGSTLLKSKTPNNWKAGPNNKGPSVNPAGKRERQQAIVNRLEKEFNELVSQSSRTMNQEKRLQNLTGSLYAERDALRNMYSEPNSYAHGKSRRRRGGSITPNASKSPQEIRDEIMNKYGCKTQYECSTILYRMTIDPNLTRTQQDEARDEYNTFMSALYASVGGRRKSKTRRNRKN